MHSHRLTTCLLIAMALLAVASTPALAAPPTPTPAAPGIEVTDALSRTVTFAGPPERIVAAGRAVRLTVDTLYVFPEAHQRIVAMEGRSPSMIEFLSLINPDIQQVEFLERDSGPEQIAATRPDAVILKSYLADKLGRPIEQLGIPVVYIDLETPDQFFRDLTTLGQLFGNPARAEEVAAFFQARLDAVAEGVKALPAEQKPRVLILQHSDQGGQVAFSVPPPGWIQTTLVDLAGGRPVWGEAAGGSGWTVVNFEQIAAWNPDVICVVTYTGEPDEVTAALKADPGWQALAAVKAGRLYAFPTDFTGYNWDQPDTRWILGLSWLARQLHPDRFATLDLIEEVYDFHGRLYGLDRAAVEAGILPALRGDIE
jgi:iron complex transport system substrate-binding protein